MPTLEKRLSCELADSEAVSPLSQEERDAMQTSKAATLAQRRHKNKKAMENAIRENKWMIFSAFDSHEDADLAFLAHFMTTASKSLRRLHDAGSEKSSQMTSPSEATPSMKRLDSHDSANQSKRMLEQNVTDEILPPPPQDGYIVLKKKLSSRSVIKISSDRLDSSESIINITRKNSSRASIGSTGSAGSGMSLRDTINVAMATSAEGNAATGAASTTAVSSAKSSGSRCKPTGLLSLTSNALEEVEDINNFEIPSGALSMDGVKAIISCYRKNGKLSENSLHKVLRLGYKSLKMLPNTTRVGVGSGERLTVVGDIHGQIWDLLHILDENGLPSASNKYVFNGDFVDRGPFGVEVMCVLLALHSACPSGVHLNRGNHEDFAICTVYGFQNECINKYDDVAFGMFCEIFNHLPLFAIIEVHGLRTSLNLVATNMLLLFVYCAGCCFRAARRPLSRNRCHPGGARLHQQAQLLVGRDRARHGQSGPHSALPPRRILKAAGARRALERPHDGHRVGFQPSWGRCGLRP